MICLFFVLPIVLAQQTVYIYGAPSTASNATWMKCDGVVGDFSAESNVSFVFNATDVFNSIQVALFTTRLALFACGA